jgi:hypothetical protein
MSGPIVRKYGFPNFENIFGAREIQHGRDAQPSNPPHPLAGEAPDDLIPDLQRGDSPADAASASDDNTMAPSTEFGQAAG